MQEKMTLAQKLKQEFPTVIIKENERLDAYTYTKTGGPVDALVFPVSKEDVQAVVTWTNTNQIPLTILGNSSNVIVRKEHD